MTVWVSGLAPNTGYDLFVIEIARNPLASRDIRAGLQISLGIAVACLERLNFVERMGPKAYLGPIRSPF